MRRVHGTEFSLKQQEMKKGLQSKQRNRRRYAVIKLSAPSKYSI